MAKYVSFDFTDGECTHYPIIVRINEDVEFSVLKNINDVIKKQMKKYIDNQDYWDTDEILVDEVMKKCAKKYHFTYEIVSIDLCIDCD